MIKIDHLRDLAILFHCWVFSAAELFLCSPVLFPRLIHQRMSQSSSDTDPELLLFSRADQRGMLDVVKDEVGVDLSQDMEDFSDSLVTPAASNGQASGNSPEVLVVQFLPTLFEVQSIQ